MLRAMWLELKAHAEKHPNEPFDHERHMPECMKAARDDPATWASGGGAGPREVRTPPQLEPRGPPGRLP